MKLRDALSFLTQQLRSLYDTPDITHTNAVWLLAHITHLSPTAIVTQLDTYHLTAQHTDFMHTCVQQLVHEKKPLQYLLGTVPFGELSLYVEPPVLIPRPETEEWCMQLIETITQRGQIPQIIIDLCTGSGCIALSLAHAFPDSTVYAVDIQPHAIELVTKNMRAARITNCIPVLSDLYDALPPLQADIIVANPPYISETEYRTLEPHITKWEDPQALVAADDGLAIITKIIAHAPRFLHPVRTDAHNIPAQLWIEIGATQADAVVRCFLAHHFSSVTVIPDIHCRDRVVTGVYE